MAATALLRLAALSGRDDLEAVAVSALRSARGVLDRYPTAAGQSLIALDFLLGTRRELVLAAGNDATALDEVMRDVTGRFSPNLVVAPVPADAGEARHPLALLEGRAPVDGQLTGYLCEDRACGLPLVGPEAVSRALAELS
jgi:uncharacterized protein YyaL (SSP411 family)